MEKQREFLKNYTDRLIEKGKCFPNIGLWTVKWGLPFICCILPG